MATPNHPLETGFNDHLFIEFEEGEEKPERKRPERPERLARSLAIRRSIEDRAEERRLKDLMRDGYDDIDIDR
jgi:hypothetical protein